MGKAQLDTSDQNRLKFENKCLNNIGLTVFSLFDEKPLICNDLEKDLRFSCYNIDNNQMNEWECSHFCEHKASNIFSNLVFPFGTSVEGEQLNNNENGVNLSF